MIRKKILPLIALSVLAVAGCVKKEINLEQVNTPELDPSFAMPLGEVNLNLGDLEAEADINNLQYNNSTTLFELVYKNRLFELTANDLITIPNQNYTSSFSLTPSNVTAFLATSVGITSTFLHSASFTFNVANGAQLDSIVIQSGTLDLNLSSDFMHNVVTNITIPSLTQNGMPLQKVNYLNYGGSTPVVSNNPIDISGYTLDLTDGGSTNNTFKVDIPIQITNSGNGLLGSEQLTTAMNLTIGSFETVWGYVGQQTNIINQDTTLITMFQETGGGDIHFEDPRIEITIGNTSGVEVQTQFSAILAPDNSTVINLGGSGLNSIPLITGATSPGDTAITTHTIDNSNTSPTLEQLIDEGPGKLIFNSTSTTNPNGFAQNFVLGDAGIWCDAELILPLYGWARNFILKDTTDLDVESMLGIDTASNLTAEDVKQATIRIIVDNGLPIDAGVQIYFADTNHVIIDSLFQTTAGIENIFEHGMVDFSLPLTDPNYGKVTQSTVKTTDIVLTQELIQKLLDNNSKKLIYKAKGLTNDANSGQNVKIYPEYNVGIKVSAKVDFLIDLQH